MSPTCPSCRHVWTSRAERLAARRRERVESDPDRAAYRRDYYRGRRHAAAGRPAEPEQSPAYYRGHSYQAPKRRPR